MTPVLVVGAAIVRGRPPTAEVLVTQRAEPPELAGQWEFPGGKVEPGESPEEALTREIYEELGLVVDVGARVGPDVLVADGRLLLRVHLAAVRSGELRLVEHLDARWLHAGVIDAVDWIEADAPVVAAVAAVLMGDASS